MSTGRPQGVCLGLRAADHRPLGTLHWATAWAPVPKADVAKVGSGWCADVGSGIMHE